MWCLTFRLFTVEKSPVLSTKNCKLPAIQSPRPKPRRRKRTVYNIFGTLGTPSSSYEATSLDPVVAYGASCAAHFLSEGDNQKFEKIFGDFLRAMSNINPNGFKYTSRCAKLYKKEEEYNNDVALDIIKYKMPCKRLLNDLKITLIGTTECKALVPLPDLAATPMPASASKQVARPPVEVEEETGQDPLPEFTGTPPASASEQVSSLPIEAGEVTGKYPLPELVANSSPASATEQVASSPVEVAE